jgi:hypothetical protein
MTTIERLLEEVFSVGFVPRLYKEDTSQAAVKLFPCGGGVE